MTRPVDSPTLGPAAPTIYTPPNWADQKALYAITFAASTSQTVDENGVLRLNVTQAGNGYNPQTGITMFVFDALRRAGHSLTAIPTKHPLQTGFNTSDHIIVQPKRLILEIGMNDSIAAYSNGPGLSMWGSNPSKSVAAFQQMELLMNNRQMMTINTRLETYTGMFLISIDADETNKTYFGGLSAILTFEQLFISEVAIQTDSARAQTTAQTQLGQVQPQTVDAATLNQYQVSQSTFNKLAFQIPGAGLFSSSIFPTP